MTGISGKAGEDRCAREARVRVGWIQGEKSKKNGLCVFLKQGNVATFGATSRRYREGLCQRRDVRGNVAMFQRVLLSNIATLGYQRRDVPETAENPRRDVPEGLKINVATLEFHVATFQRHSKSTSRR